MEPKELLTLARIVASIKEKVKCSLCKDYVQNAAEIGCGHAFCNDCLNGQKLCIICKTIISKTKTIYKDDILNAYSKFVDQTSQAIKEIYAYEVEDLIKNSKEIDVIVKTAPTHLYAPPKCVDNINDQPEVIEGTFDNLLSTRRRCYINSRKQINQKQKKKNILNFEDQEQKSKVIRWLTENKEKLDFFTQDSNHVLKSTNGDFNMPSISQVNQNVVRNLEERSQSLTIGRVSPKVATKRQYLSQTIHEFDNYNIEEVQSEEIVKQVERKVLQDMLEDEYLANLENVAKNTLSKSITNTKRKKSERKDLSHSISSGEGTSGWDRIGTVKKTLKKMKRTPKELKIVLQDSENHQKNAKMKNTKSKKRKSNKNKENPTTALKADVLPEMAQNKCYNLRHVENFFEENMSVNEHLKNISYESDELNNDMPTNNKAPLNLKDQKNTSNESLDEHIFLRATQRTSESLKQIRNVYCISPVSKEINDTYRVITELNEKLNKCIEDSKTLDNTLSLSLVDCFTNLNTYIQRFIEIKDTKKTCSKGTQTSDVEKNPTNNVYAQTDEVQYLNQEVQTTTVETLEVSLQTITPIIQHREIQTDEYFSSKSKIVNTNLPLSDVDTGIKAVPKVQTPIQNALNSSKQLLNSTNKTHIHKASLTSNISINKYNIKSTDESQNSVLFCTLKTTGSSKKQINKKLFSEETERKFKRIRQHSSDTESDDGIRPKKRKLVREDLTIEFQDTEKANSDAENLSESDKMDCDEYLLEVMKKYGTPNKTATSLNNSGQNKENKSSASPTKLENTKTFQRHLNEKDPFSGESCIEDIISKIDFQKFEHVKETNTETEIVENTPFEVKSKVVRLPASKGKLRIQIPIQIISKSSMCTSKKMVSHNLEKHDNDLSENVSRTCDLNKAISPKESTNKLNITSENIDEILNEINNFENNQEIDAELEHISFTAEANKLDQQQGKITILQNVLVGDDPGEVIDETDEEFVEVTPQKKKKKINGSLLHLEEPMDNQGFQDLDICLPPPPGFDDGNPDDDIDDNDVLAEFFDQSMTPERPSQFLTTSKAEKMKKELGKEHNESKSKICTSAQYKFKNINSEMDAEVFSPIAASAMSNMHFTPFISTSKFNKKSNILTSTPNQKSILNYVRPSQEKLRTAWQKPKPYITWSRIANKDLKNVFKELELKKLVTTSESFNSQVTHLIVTVDEKGQLKSHTAKFLLAVAAGIWVVRSEWAVDCLKMGKILPEEPYEVLDLTGAPGPQCSRLTSKTKPLFKDYVFFCAPPFSTVPIKDVENMISMLKGETVHDMNAFFKHNDKIKLILTDTSATEDIEKFDDWLEMYGTLTVDIEWFIRCVAQYKLLSVRPFVLSSEDNIADLNYPPALLETVPFNFTETL